MTYFPRFQAFRAVFFRLWGGYADGLAWKWVVARDSNNYMPKVVRRNNPIIRHFVADYPVSAVSNGLDE